MSGWLPGKSRTTVFGMKRKEQGGVFQARPAPSVHCDPVVEDEATTSRLR